MSRKKRSSGKKQTLTPPLPRTLPPDHVEPGKASVCFAAPSAIKKLLQEAGARLSSDVPREAEHYLKSRERCNAVWTRPDRLWLWTAFDFPHHHLKSLRFNGIDIAFEKEMYNFRDLSAEGLYFADVTEIIRYDAVNTLDAEYSTPGGNPVFYLSYPQPEFEEVPGDAKLQILRKNLTWHPLCRQAPLRSRKVQITAAHLNEDNVMRQNEENELSASVNLPPEELEGVYASVPISIGASGDHLRHDMALTWENGTWHCKFSSGGRMGLIVDDDKIVLWAVTRHRRESAGFSLPIEWEL